MTLEIYLGSFSFLIFIIHKKETVFLLWTLDKMIQLLQLSWAIKGQKSSHRVEDGVEKTWKQSMPVMMMLSHKLINPGALL